MKVLLINGSPRQHGCTDVALSEVEKTLQAQGIETEILWLGNKPIAGCISCFSCFKTGKCIQNDKVNELSSRLDEFDGIIVGSPVYYSGPAGQLTAFLDRFFFVNADKLAGKLGASVVSCRRGGATASFDRLNKYFTICNMPVVPSQYWNQIHGMTPDEARQDLEGLQTMRTLGLNMAWLLKCIDAGRKAGINLPEYEQPVLTNFIR
ncbi:MAG: flavodoxin family protein [Synergistaceae bacterium]|nr:flavodoxin family protein [Synergistaceae bacterium]MBQ4419516.1 flavodoxin family protein [Synergistaceae bacterium]MBQ6740528.1 flavodoxin family protein [Synergistaceae bacterium]MBQ7570052.1 flavodoxin family protein [Synergistaceae bacterium]MBQ9581240.1 flavodoxin family protein [Synergistaceae bacterium]